MPNYTENYNLKKPLSTENYDVKDQNDNMDLIDQALKDKIDNSLATAADQVLVSSGIGAWAIKTLAQIKTWLGLGSAAYTNSNAYATAAQGTTADNTAAALTTHTADNMQYLINVKHPPNGLAEAKGDGVTNDTIAINAIVQYAKTNKCGGIYFPDSTGAYMIDGNDLADTIYYNANGGILIDSPMRVILHPNAKLQAITSDKIGYKILNIKNATDVYVEGGKILGERSTHIGTTGEFGYGIAIMNASNVHVSKTIVQDCWGDGLFVGAIDGDTSTYCHDIYLSKVKSKNNRRQGLSIVSGQDVHINDCEFSETNGTAPEAGIDIEANGGYPDNKHIFINHCKFNGNKKYDVVINTIAKNINISNCEMTDSEYASIAVGSLAQVDKLIVGNCNIDLANSVTGSKGIVLSGSLEHSIISDNIISNIPSTTSGAGIELASSLTGVKITDNDISFCKYGVSFTGTASSTKIDVSKNKIHDVTDFAVYAYMKLLDSSIDGNTLYNLGTSGIFANMTNCLITGNTFKDGQQWGIVAVPISCLISNNKFNDMGIGGIGADYYASIELNTGSIDNYIYANRVRNSRAGHIGIRNNAAPATPNLVSKNDLRFAVASVAIRLNAADINDENFTL